MSSHTEAVVGPHTPAPPLAALQRELGAAILAARAPIPAAVVAPSEAQRRKRFGVYRNNVHASLAAALSARFPVTERIVGEEFFRAMALVFVAHHPPATPVLAEYGAHFADFVERFEPAAEVAYLPDVVRLEWLRNVAYHAADAEAIDIAALAGLDPSRLSEARLVVHPATGLVASSWPIASIWRTNTFDEVVKRIVLDARGEAALVTRPGLEVLVTALPPGAELLLRFLASGAPLGEAAETAQSTEPQLDLPSALAALFAAGAFAGISQSATELSKASQK